MTSQMALADDFNKTEPPIEAVRFGDRQAFEQFVRAYGRWIRGVIYGILGDSDRVDDVSQQVWATVWTRIGELRDLTRWKPWLYRLARNAALDAGRERARRKKWARAANERPSGGEAAGSVDGVLSGEEARRTVRRAIENLPAIYREPLVLKHLNGWSYQEIADVLDMPVDSVETRLVRARRMLREQLRGRV